MVGTGHNKSLAEDLTWASYHWALPDKCGEDLEPIPGAGAQPPGAKLDWQEGWHVYAVEWFPDRLDFYLDDDLVLSRRARNSSAAEAATEGTPGVGGVLLPPAPMYIIFDQVTCTQQFHSIPPSP